MLQCFSQSHGSRVSQTTVSEAVAGINIQENTWVRCTLNNIHVPVAVCSNIIILTTNNTGGVSIWNDAFDAILYMLKMWNLSAKLRLLHQGGLQGACTVSYWIMKPGSATLKTAGRSVKCGNALLWTAHVFKNAISQASSLYTVCLSVYRHNVSSCFHYHCLFQLSSPTF